MIADRRGIVAVAVIASSMLGERVIMTRTAHNRTLAIHAECGDKRHGTAEWTWRDAMAAWGADYLRAVGWRMQCA